MKSVFRKLYLSIATVAALYISAVAISAFAIAPRDALYPSVITCACGHTEYLTFNGDRGLMWNMGHNRKDEYFKLQESGEGFDLLNWKNEKFAHIEFGRFSIRWKNEGKEDQIIYREYNFYRLLSNWMESQNETICYESLEQKIQKSKTEPNQ